MGVRKFVRRLPPWGEFAIVVSLAFGLFISESVWDLVAASSNQPIISEGDLRFVLAYELIAFAVLLTFLSVRGWTAASVGLTPSFEDTLLGAAVLAAGWLAYIVTAVFVATVWPQAFRMVADVHLTTGKLNFPTLMAASAVNGFYEELFVCGYVMTALGKRFSPWTAINISVIIRFSYHLYQGPLAVVSIIPMGLTFAYLYARTGRLWPLVVAHAAGDFLAFATHAGG